MASLTDIYNGALTACGRPEIADPDEKTPAAQMCRTKFPTVRDRVLRSHPWACAEEQAQLATTANSTLYDFTNAFALPTDPYCLRVLSVRDDPEFRVRRRQIHTDAPAPLYITFTARIDPEEYDEALVELMQLELGLAICMRLTESQTRYDAIKDRLKEIKSESRGVDSQQGTPRRAKSGTFRAVRGRGY